MTPEEFITAYELALASKRWENVEPLIDDNAVVRFSTGSVHKGIEAIKEAYEKNFAAIKNEEYKVTGVNWAMKENDLAVYVFTFEWKGIVNGQQTGGSGRGLVILILEDDKWKLIGEALSAV